MPLCAFGLLLCLVAAAAGSEIPRVAPAEVGLAQDRLNRITRHLQDDVERGHLAGAIGVVARRGRIAYWETVGLADKESGAPLRDDTIFRIYSMTKPVVGVALMTLYEEGKFSLDDPVKKHLPELGGMLVADGEQDVPARRKMTVQDLMRHTSGMIYGSRGPSRVERLWAEADLLGGNRSIDDFIRKLAKLPLRHHPGEAWDYSVSVDVQGRLIEVLSGMHLAAFLQRRVFEPLGMRDTGFTVPPNKKDRFVQMYRQNKAKNAIEPAPPDLSEGYFDHENRWYSGGGGLVSTTRDYLRFCQMLLNGGVLDGCRVLGRKTLALMTADHIEGLPRASRVLGPGYGFGLDFAVHIAPAESGLNGSVGEFNWGGLAGTSFWVDPAEELVGLYMIQMLPPRFEDSGGQFKRLVY